MNRLLLAFLLFMFSCTAWAQNWQTVLVGRGNYFTAGEHRSYKGFYYYPGQQQILTKVDSPMLRVIFVTNAFQSGADSVFQFYTSFRDGTDSVGGTGCADTLGPSWLGPKMVRKADGTELYFNSRHDTIEIRTLARQGESWILANDTTGRQFVGTIAQTGTMVIDGVPDSFKTVSIQAYSANMAIAHPYNNKMLQWSKSHGWLKALDFYRFPNYNLGRRTGWCCD